MQQLESIWMIAFVMILQIPSIRQSGAGAIETDD